MLILHGVPTVEKLRKCRAAAPSHCHGAMWLPERFTAGVNVPYALDNGCFAARERPEEWSADAWLSRVEEIPERANGREPEFVVLPDVVGDADASELRTRTFAKRLDARGLGSSTLPRAVAAQDGMTPARVLALAEAVNAATVFIGGSDRWKLSHAEELTEAAHDAGLSVHIGRPPAAGFADALAWAEALGVESVDTTSVTRGERYNILERFERQTTLGDHASGA
ncbi:hypothetical protein [Halorussus marinus]|uniref:hypothetical protein n=1 Tax=Halorussus marinus TaxID=2505976 RepID=UPI001092142A|nr:hypothetical protein [Halorussus marinus]